MGVDVTSGQGSIRDTSTVSEIRYTTGSSASVAHTVPSAATRVPTLRPRPSFPNTDPRRRAGPRALAAGTADPGHGAPTRGETWVAVPGLVVRAADSVADQAAQAG